MKHSQSNKGWCTGIEKVIAKNGSLSAAQLEIVQLKMLSLREELAARNAQITSLLADASPPSVKQDLSKVTFDIDQIMVASENPLIVWPCMVASDAYMKRLRQKFLLDMEGNSSAVSQLSDDYLSAVMGGFRNKPCFQLRKEVVDGLSYTCVLTPRSKTFLCPTASAGKAECLILYKDAKSQHNLIYCPDGYIGDKLDEYLEAFAQDDPVFQSKSTCCICSLPARQKCTCGRRLCSPFCQKVDYVKHSKALCSGAAPDCEI